MATTIKQSEAVPASYPAAPSGLSTAAQALDSDMLWARIEAHIAHRWTTREVTWVAEGEGEWAPPLAPATVSTVEVWESAAWSSTTPPASALGGYDFPGEGPYRITADVGGGTVPAEVEEAIRRLAEYLAETPDRQGAGRYEVQIDQIRESFDRTPAWVARAMHLSGAADLLRRYRRAN